MSQHDKEKPIIPIDEQQNILDNYWLMLRECETKVENNPSDAVLKQWVEQWYRLYSRVTGSPVKANWE
jgi:hypothetical protein